MINKKVMYNISAYSGTELKEKPVPWLIIVTPKNNRTKGTGYEQWSTNIDGRTIIVVLCQ